MPLPVISNVYRCALNWSDTDSGKIAANVIHVRGVGSINTVGTANGIDASVTQAMWDWAANTAAVDSLVVTPLDGATASYTKITNRPLKWTGAGSSQSIPQVAGIVKLQTVFRGPSYRGRVFIPFVSEGEQDGGRLIDVAAVQTAWVLFQANLAALTSPLTLVVASYKNATAQAVVITTAEPVTGTQRRRQRR